MAEEHAKAYHIAGGVQPESEQYSNWFEFLDGDYEKMAIVDATPDGGSLIMTRSFGVGRPVKPEHVPTKLRRCGPGIKRQPLLDVNSFKLGLLVPKIFKDILEGLEPGVHQFFPIEIFDKQDNKIGEEYWFIFCQRLDTLHDTACEPGRDERGFVINKGPDGKHILPKKVYSGGKIKGVHAWVDKFGGGRLISGEFGARLKPENLTGLKFKPLHVE